MAPGAGIIALKAMTDSGEGEFTEVELALQWVVANAAAYNIASVNMSLGDEGNYDTPQSLYGVGDELAALAAISVIVVSASGNDFHSLESVPGVSYPAADPNSLSVGAVYDADVGGATYANGAEAFTTAADRVTPFSQREATLTTVMAPGASIMGAFNSPGIYVSKHGTSQAAPHIAGIAVLAQQLAVQELGRRLTSAEFGSLLAETGVMVNDGDDEDDNVTNTGLDFPRVDVFALAEAIVQFGYPAGTHRVVIDYQQNAEDVDFGNRDTALPSHVEDRHVFYNNSAFDGNNPVATVGDDNAVAVYKEALLPGNTAGFANYTSYTQGINGIMVDVAGLTGTPTAADFRFKAGNYGDPDAWQDAVGPSSVTVRPGAGTGGSDRITLVWEDSAVVGQWLRVTVLDTENTGLAQPDVFYLGNAVGEAGDSDDDAAVNSLDVLLTRNNPHSLFNPATVNSHLDFNRDRRVNATDMLIARSNQTHFLDALKLIAVPAGKDAGVKSAAVDSAIVDDVSVFDAVFEQAADCNVWLYALEETVGNSRSSKESRTAEEVVEELLAEFES